MKMKRIVEYNAATRIDLVIRRNDNPWRARFRVADHDGNPIDMTGYGAKLQLRLYEGMPGIPNLAISVPIYSFFIDSLGNKLTFSGGEKFVTRDAPGGSEITMLDDGFDVAIVADDILSVPPSPLIDQPMILSYDVLVTTPSGDENAWYEGNVVIRDGVSRSLTQADRDAIYNAYYGFEVAA